MSKKKIKIRDNDPESEREINLYDNPIPSRELILQVMSDHGIPINKKELLNTLHDILLPIVQKRELQKNIHVIKTISAITDSKQVAIVKYIINNLDNNNIFIASYTNIMEEISILKLILIKLLKELAS